MSTRWSKAGKSPSKSHLYVRRLIYITERGRLTEMTVTFESVTKIEPVAKVPRQSFSSTSNINFFVQFEHAGLHPVMLANVKLCGYKIPTPIQAYCLPSVLKGIDIIGIAQTGKHLMMTEAIRIDHFRIGQDGGIFDPYTVQAHGKSQKVGCSASESYQGLDP